MHAHGRARPHPAILDNITVFRIQVPESHAQATFWIAVTRVHYTHAKHNADANPFLAVFSFIVGGDVIWNQPMKNLVRLNPFQQFSRFASCFGVHYVRESGASYLAHPKPLKAVFLSVVVSGWSLSDCALFALDQRSNRSGDPLQDMDTKPFRAVFWFVVVLQSVRYVA